MEGAASFTITHVGGTARRRVVGDGSSLLSECRQRNSPVLVERARTLKSSGAGLSMCNTWRPPVRPAYGWACCRPWPRRNSNSTSNTSNSAGPARHVQCAEPAHHRTRTCNSDTKRLACVEPSLTNKGGPHTERIEHGGKTVFCGKAKRSKKEQGEPEAEEGMDDATAKLT